MQMKESDDILVMLRAALTVCMNDDNDLEVC